MSKPVGNLRKQTLEEIWHGAEMKEVRTMMLAGRTPEHCSRCEAAETAGYRSLRQSANEKFKPHLNSCVDVSPEYNPVYLDFRFSNLCNFRCRTCGPAYSSAWYSDARHLGDDQGEPPLRRWGDWRKAKPYILAAEEINFAGGEPLISEDHYQIIKLILRDKDRRKPRLTYNTNLATLRYKEMFFRDVWSRFSSVRVSASIDAWGRQGELIRKGKKWQIFENNITQLWQDRKHLSLGFTLTVSVLNVQRIPQLLDILSCAGFLGPGIHLDINFLDGPSYYSTQILPAEMKKAISAELSKLIGDEKQACRYGSSAAEALQAVVMYMNGKDRSKEIGKFLQVTQDLDVMRGEHTFSTLPELEPLRKQRVQPAGRA